MVKAKCNRWINSLLMQCLLQGLFTLCGSALGNDKMAARQLAPETRSGYESQIGPICNFYKIKRLADFSLLFM